MNWNTFSHIFAFSSLLFSWLLFFPLKNQMRVTWIYNFQSMWETSAQLSKVQMFSQYFTDENRLFYVRDSYLELQIQSIKVDGLHFIFCQPLEWSCALVVADRFFFLLSISVLYANEEMKRNAYAKAILLSIVVWPMINYLQSKKKNDVFVSARICDYYMENQAEMIYWEIFMSNLFDWAL